MGDRDLHLASASLSEITRSRIEALGFTEDFFRNCENCAPTLYHATFRAAGREIDNALWSSAVDILISDSKFNGILEQERLMSEYRERRSVAPTVQPLPLSVQQCPADIHKRSDVHVAVKYDGDSAPTMDWLRVLNIASFDKARHDGAWRIFTVTFDTVEAGILFAAFVTESVPRLYSTDLKIKHEAIERALRHPHDATTLPITFERQLTEWIELVGASGTEARFHRVV